MSETKTWRQQVKLGKENIMYLDFSYSELKKFTKEFGGDAKSIWGMRFGFKTGDFESFLRYFEKRKPSTVTLKKIFEDDDLEYVVKL